MRPKFCPQCSKGLKGALATVEQIGSDGLSFWETYCEDCGWSGRISSPDIEEA